MSASNYWQRLRSHRLSRRGLLQASTRAAVGGAGFALVGCGEEDDAAMIPAQSASQQSEQSAPSESQPQPPEERDVQATQDAPPQSQQQERTMTDDEIREMLDDLKKVYTLAKEHYGRPNGATAREQRADRVQTGNAMAVTASALVALENELRR